MLRSKLWAALLEQKCIRFALICGAGILSCNLVYYEIIALPDTVAQAVACSG